MIAAVLKEITPDENRVAATPQTVKDLIKSGLTIRVESGAGDASYISDGDYKNVGAEIFPDPSSILKDADIILKVAPATKEEIDKFPDNAAYISLCQTTRELELVKLLNNKKITGFSMHLIPRTTLAQS
ncbi:MAG: NAD(P)(+) transhydrogenase (Re/Si-specific) subunit alpha, partial [Candidatus Marinimicrobia bacterium]|nr:NAD(P)(+) transhydrogenase (Re/Si-specific) subunit alpha [Candidatus Neomarinimicrobiota bacterium]